MSPVDVRPDHDDKTMVRPDVAILSAEKKIMKWEIMGAPDFVAEVLSPSTKRKDCIKKPDKYMAAGVKEYGDTCLRKKRTFMKQILMIEDDHTIVYGLSELLKEEGFSVKAVSSLQETSAMDIRCFTLILLDLALPDGEGFSFLEKISKCRIPSPPVIILTAKDDETDIIKGLDMGADDYVTKPFKTHVLLSRIRAVLRRRGKLPETEEILTCGNILLDRQQTIVMAHGLKIALTAGEFRLLQYLMENKNRTLTRNALLSHFWDSTGDYVNDNTLTVTIKRLREKLGTDSRQMLKTVRGIGYRMEDTND